MIQHRQLRKPNRRKEGGINRINFTGKVCSEILNLVFRKSNSLFHFDLFRFLFLINFLSRKVNFLTEIDFEKSSE